MDEQGKDVSRVELLIFDLDGTLIDSEEDLALSVNATREQKGLAPLPASVIASYVGDGVPALVRRALGAGMQEEEVQRALSFFLDYYREHMLDHTVTYPGVREALEALRSRILAVLTNKPVNFARGILEGLGMLERFSFVYGGNSFARKKPDPVGVVRLMQDTGKSGGETMLIGDSATDIETGRHAGIWTCGVTYGIGSASLRDATPDFLVNDLRELPVLLNGRAQAYRQKASENNPSPQLPCPSSLSPGRGKRGKG
jgi:phosphoglycolate phosphatase